MPSGTNKDGTNNGFKKGCKGTNYWLGKKRPEMSGEKHPNKKLKNRKKQSKIMKIKAAKGENAGNWKGGINKDKEYVAWRSNKRQRVIKRLKIESLSHTYGEWELLKKQYGNTCPCCHKSEPEIKLTEDHIIPLSKGGSDLIENIQPLCSHCNKVKNVKIIKYEIKK